MEFLYRGKGREVSSELMALMWERFDKFLDAAWSKLSNTQLVPSEFVTLHPCVRLVLNEDSFAAVLAVRGTESLLTVKGHLKTLVPAGALGRKLFGQAAKQVVALEVRGVITSSPEEARGRI
eukprot:2183992-Amphidinium_carterae.2